MTTLLSGVCQASVAAAEMYDGSNRFGSLSGGGALRRAFGWPSADNEVRHGALLRSPGARVNSGFRRTDPEGDKGEPCWPEGVVAA